VLAVMIVDHWPRLRRIGGATGFRAPASGRWSFAADCAVALPLFTLLAPFLGAGAEYALLVKLLMFRRVFSIHRLLDDLPDLHPVLARLIPLGLILPIVINLLACGWTCLGGGTAGTGPDRTLNYIRAVYWTITTLATVGYGDITPEHHAADDLCFRNHAGRHRVLRLRARQYRQSACPPGRGARGASRTPQPRRVVHEQQ
jgi:hypothetical protein